MHLERSAELVHLGLDALAVDDGVTVLFFERFALDLAFCSQCLAFFPL